jgi:hypothetical protein
MSKRSMFSLCIIFGMAGVVTLLGYLVYLGYFDKIKVTEQQMGPLFLVYRSQKGDYRHTGKTVGELVLQLQSVGASDVKGFAIYQDDPTLVKAEDLRSEVGVILPERDRKRAAGIMLQYETKLFPKMEGAVASFPLRNTFSVYVGAYKVHHKLVEFVHERKMETQYILEIYDFGKSTTYFMPFSEQKI